MDETNNFTLMTWTPQGNSLTPIATLTFAQIGTGLIILYKALTT